ncbi:putative E3 ubiquitin-protein ligase HERC1 [Symbiodinium microadriaticum]|uniref:Putative E3 ubiquitin-protein ligase HERC1 n=1 Tax=Symbiodinium microadriaticum TaxID=2951 RepID=A0A1Q9F530_SYMMI|nr:putative E3 ubiquitin-protein ligase HERC1 [Symbiodinium microadriaticum]
MLLRLAAGEKCLGVIKARISLLSQSTHVQYNIRVHQEGKYHMVQKRFSDFVTLHDFLKMQFGSNLPMELPSKTPIRYFNQDKIENRKHALNAYLRELCRRQEMTQLLEVQRFFGCQGAPVPVSTTPAAPAYQGYAASTREPVPIVVGAVLAEVVQNMRKQEGFPDGGKILFFTTRRKVMDELSKELGVVGLTTFARRTFTFDKNVCGVIVDPTTVTEETTRLELAIVAANIMSIPLEVGLLSGKTATVEAGLDEDVQSLKLRAEIALGVGRGRLLDASGNILAPWTPVIEARLQTGGSLTLHVSRVQLSATCWSFAAILGDASAVTWGAAVFRGDSGAVQEQLKNVQQIQATDYAFAAILGDGSVLTWGDADTGGDNSAVQDQLKDVQQIQATSSAFAAILGDGSVVTWGDADIGGDSSAVQDQLKDVQQIQATSSAFAAILGDGSVVTWGDADIGGDSSAVQDQLKDVQQIQATSSAFAAILGDGSVVTWGDADIGGDSSAVQDQLKDVQQIQATSSAFAAILGDGSVVTWGDADIGGDSSAVQDQLKDVQQIQATSSAFAAILGDGSVVTWGDADIGGDSSAVQDQLKDVQQIQATSSAFAAILGDGSVVTWGDADFGGDSSASADLLVPFTR